MRSYLGLVASFCVVMSACAGGSSNDASAIPVGASTRTVTAGADLPGDADIISAGNGVGDAWVYSTPEIKAELEDRMHFILAPDSEATNADRLDGIVGSEGLAGVINAAELAENTPLFTFELSGMSLAAAATCDDLGGVVCLDATYDLVFESGPFGVQYDVVLVSDDDDVWRVNRDAFCALSLLAQAPCPGDEDNVAAIATGPRVDGQAPTAADGSTAGS